MLDNFRDGGFALNEVVACGGIAEKSPLLMQMFADACGLPVVVPASSQVPARGSALFGAVAAGEEAGGFGAIAEAARALRPPTGSTLYSRTEATAIYGEVYGIWKDLHDTLGRAQPDVASRTETPKTLGRARVGPRHTTKEVIPIARQRPKIGLLGIMQELYDDMIPGITDHQANYAKELAGSFHLLQTWCSCDRRAIVTT